ncbi:MAG: tetratricopeptide repeat protein, partial [Acidobacteriota bacterium]
MTTIHAATSDVAEARDRSDLQALYDQAMAAQGEGRLDDAVADLERALALAEARGDDEARVTLLVHLGRLYSIRGESREAIERYRRARDLLRASGDQPKLAIVLNALGFEQVLVADFAAARENLQESKTLLGEAADPETRKAVLRTLLVAHRELAEGDKLRAVAKELIELARDTGDQEALDAARNAREMADALLDDDKAWEEQVDYWKAQLVASSLDLDGIDAILDDAEARGWTGREEVEAFDAKAIALHMLALLYQEKQRWDDVIDVGEDHVTHLLARGEPIEAARRLTLLAGDYQEAGRYLDGIRAVDDAMRHLVEVETPTAEQALDETVPSGRALTLIEREAIRGRAQRRLAMLYQQMGDVDAALVALGIDDCRLQVIDNALDPELQLLIARLCFERGWNDSAHAAAQRARSIAETALEASRRHQLQAHDLLSIAAHVEGGEANWRIALDHTFDMLRLTRDSDGPSFPWIDQGTVASLQERLAYLYANLGDDESALRHAEQAIANAADDAFSQVLGYSAKGFVHLRAGRWQRAEAALRRAAAGWEAIQASVADDERLRATLLDAQLSTFELLQETLICAGRSALALEVAERARARALSATLAGEIGLDPSTVDPPT